MAAFDKYKNEHMPCTDRTYLRLTGLHENAVPHWTSSTTASQPWRVHRVPHRLRQPTLQRLLGRPPPESQGDPYKIASRILQTIATVPTKKGKKNRQTPAEELEAARTKVRAVFGFNQMGGISICGWGEGGIVKI